MTRPAPTRGWAKEKAEARLEDLLHMVEVGRCGYGEICNRLGASPTAMYDFCRQQGRDDLAQMFPLPPEPYKYHYRPKPTHKEREERRHGQPR